MTQLSIADKNLEYVWHGPAAGETPTLVFLHEGLGCVEMWRDFPERLAEATGCSALVYSRAGYGHSDPKEGPWPVGFMHEEGLVVLPTVLDAFAIRKAILVGHSDGGSIAIIHAGGTRNPRVRGLILEAPHVFVEEVGLESIRGIAELYRGENAPKGAPFRQRLARYHGANVDQTFWGWNEVWLNPEFRSWNIEEYLPAIKVPLLLIQGSDDQYGTPEQLRKIEMGCQGPVRTVMIEACGHSPHLDQPDRVHELMKEFVECADLSAL